MSTGLLPELQPEETGEWWTPQPMRDLIARALGDQIDTDPSSCDIAQRDIVKARQYFTRERSGLDPANKWRGTVLGHFPYDLTQEFSKRLMIEMERKHVTAAIVIYTTIHLSNKWFHRMVYPHETCHIIWHGRVPFIYSEDQKPRHSTQAGTVLSYFGPMPGLFERVFYHHGSFYTPGAAR